MTAEEIAAARRETAGIEESWIAESVNDPLPLILRAITAKAVETLVLLRGISAEGRTHFR